MYFDREELLWNTETSLLSLNDNRKIFIWDVFVINKSGVQNLFVVSQGYRKIITLC